MAPAWINAPRTEEVPRALVEAWLADWHSVYPAPTLRKSRWARVRAWVYGGVV